MSRATGRGSSPAPVRDGGRVTYIVGTYPLLTTTFIDREIAAVRQHGLTVRIVSLRRPRPPLSPEQGPLSTGVRYLLPVAAGALVRSHLRFALLRPAAFWGTLLYLLTRPHASVRARTRTLLHFGEGVCVASLLRGDGPSHLHAHFVDRAATVALVVARLLGLPYSATAHANDIYVDPVILPEKLAGADFVVTCTDYNAEHLRRLAGRPAGPEIVCIHHGLDLQRYEPGGRSGDHTPMILSVGQLKEKKGLRDLVAACRLLLDEGQRFTCEIVGEGPLRAELEGQIRRLGVQDVVTLRGALAHDDVIERYRSATLFVLPCVEGADGDRDGIPNVILEAMAMQLPVVSTRLSGVPEAVIDGWSGALVDPRDTRALAVALRRLLQDAEGRERMGRRGRQRVAEEFDAATNAKELVRRFTEVRP